MKLPVREPARLPPLQQAWMDELLAGEAIPGEPRATCSQCPQVPQPGDADADLEARFDPRTKCCTYMPALYNFLAGRVLDEPDAASVPGRDTMEARIDAGHAVTPLGLLATPEYVEAYGKEHSFGRAYDLRCPHYLAGQGGLCGVWKHREGTCSTWFCKHVRGAVAFDFWRRGMTPLLRAAERALAVWCAEELGATQHEWGPYQGRPRDLYRAAAKLVEGLSWGEVEAIGGDEVAALARETQDHFRALQDGARALPERPRVSHYDVQDDDGARALLTTYTPYDALEIPTRLLRELHRFDGRPRAEVVDELKSLGVLPRPELLHQLADWRIIVESGAERVLQND